MSGVLNKFMGFIGLDDDEAEYENEFEKELDKEKSNEASNEEVEPTYLQQKKQNSNKIVNIHTASSMKVVISKPKDYEEATLICDELRNRRIVVVNTTTLEPKVAQRLLDFMCGASYVLGGELQEVEKGVYILSPSNVEVTKEIEKELTSKGFLNWSKN